MLVSNVYRLLKPYNACNIIYENKNKKWDKNIPCNNLLLSYHITYTTRQCLHSSCNGTWSI